MAQVHRAFLHFSELPLTLRVVYTGGLLVLGVGYMFAMIYVFVADAGRDGRVGLSEEDLVIAYSGGKQETRLEAALKGAMSGMAPLEEHRVIADWVNGGARRNEFEKQVEPILKKRCLLCHDGSNPNIVRLVTYDDVMKVAAADTGMSIATLIRVSHIHLFGITFIFFLMGVIFSHAHLRRTWLKVSIAGAPYIFLLADIGSWYLTKIYQPFAWVILFSGVFMAASFAAMWLISMYQLWFYKPPADAFGGRDTLW